MKCFGDADVLALMGLAEIYEPRDIGYFLG
jgi:hypothetical protein